MSFGLSSNDLNLYDPTPSVNNVKFAVLSPLWGRTYLDQVKSKNIVNVL